MKKNIFITSAIILSILFCAQTFAESSSNAKKISDASLTQDTVLESVDYLKSHLKDAVTLADKRSLLFFTGTLQEQLGLYEDASMSYAQAAGIAAGDADEMRKVTSEQLVLNAVRASLCAGDAETADKYLNSAVRSSKDENILAYINLYTQWSALCKAENFEETKDSVALLKAYSGMDSMKSVKPQVLLTVWYITGEDEYGDMLKKEFPSSLEAGVVTGKVQIMSSPFWYFVPHKGGVAEEENESSDKIEKDISSGSVDSTNDSKSNDVKTSDVAVDSKDKSNSNNSKSSSDDLSNSGSGKITREQCGLFRDKVNAENLVKALKDKGFEPFITEETRASGTTYYIVVVNENADGTMGLKLKDSGFECYPVME